MRKLLLVYPNNFLQGVMGTNTRVKQLVRMFKEIGFNIDYFSYENWLNGSVFGNFEKQNAENGNLIDHLILHDFQKETAQNVSSIERVKRHFKNKKEEQNEHLQDWCNDYVKEQFKEIANKNKYDVIVIFYTYFATLFDNAGDLTNSEGRKTKIVYFMEDSMFLQQYSWTKDQPNHPSLGSLLDEELTRFTHLDEIFCISYDEKIMYGKFLGRSLHFMPHIMPEGTKKVDKSVEERRWDVYFIGFDNPFNAEGMNWFIDKVYPQLNPDLKLVFVGSVTKRLKNRPGNVEVIPFAPSLDEIHENSKICICPMHQGTGMKIKVVEALAKGIPVVCNERGVDGLPDKTECGCLVTEDAKEFAGYINRLVEDKEYYKETVDRINRYYDKVFDYQKNLDVMRKIIVMPQLK